MSEKVIALVHRENLKNKIDLVIVDHIHALHDEPKRGETVASKYNKMMARFLDMSVSLDCAVFLLAQFNRQATIGKTPTISDLKESSSIEQYSTNVLVLHRESREATEAELIVAKARNGIVGMIPLNFEKPTTHFTQANTSLMYQTNKTPKDIFS